VNHLSKMRWLTGVGVAAVSIVTPMVSQRIFDKWFTWPNFLLLAPIPIMSAALFVLIEVLLRRAPARVGGKQDVLPFLVTVGIFGLAFVGLAYSLFPFLVVDRVTIWQAASATESLFVIFWGVCVVLPAILGYTIYAYRVFGGKASELSYD